MKIFIAVVITTALTYSIFAYFFIFREGNLANSTYRYKGKEFTFVIDKKKDLTQVCYRPAMAPDKAWELEWRCSEWIATRKVSRLWE